jgi:hypothetical protein
MWQREYGRLKDYDVAHYLFGAYTGLIMLIDHLYGLSMIGLFTLYQILDFTVTKDRPDRDVVTFMSGYATTSIIYVLEKIIGFLI